LEIFRRVDPTTGLEDPLGGVAVSHEPIAIVHPTFLYELLWNLGVAVLVVWADRRFRLGRGRAFAVYVAGYTAGRFWIELMRADEATHLFGIRINVITSVVVFLGAALYLVLVRGPREDLVALRAARQGEPAGGAQAGGEADGGDAAPEASQGEESADGHGTGEKEAGEKEAGEKEAGEPRQAERVAGSSPARQGAEPTEASSPEGPKA
jgi:hypothetical protein